MIIHTASRLFRLTDLFNPPSRQVLLFSADYFVDSTTPPTVSRAPGTKHGVHVTAHDTTLIILLLINQPPMKTTLAHYLSRRPPRAESISTAGDRADGMTLSVLMCPGLLSAIYAAGLSS
jgi:hypothetical protein